MIRAHKAIIACLFYLLITYSYAKWTHRYNQKFLSEMAQLVSGATEKEEAPKNDTAPPLNVRCYWIHNFQVYNLNKLTKEEDYLTEEVKDWKIYYNFCHDTKTKCGDEEESKTLILGKNGSRCIKFTGSINGEPTYTKYDGNNEWYEHTDKEGTYLTIDYVAGQTFGNSHDRYLTKMQIKCDPNGKENEISVNFEKFEPEERENTIYASSVHACPLSGFYALEQFINDYAILSGIIVIIIGLFFSLVGIKVIKATMILVGIFAVVGFAFFITFTFFKVESTTTIWIIFGVSAFIGIGFGILFIKLTKLFFIILGGLLGYVTGVFVYEVTLRYVSFDPQVLYWIILLVFIISFGILAMCFNKPIMILATSILGTYAIIRGASFMIGHFPSEKIIFDLIKNKEYEQLDDYRTPWVYCYFAVWAVLAVLSIYLQFRWNREKDDKKEEVEKTEQLT